MEEGIRNGEEVKKGFRMGEPLVREGRSNQPLTLCKDQGKASSQRIGNQDGTTGYRSNFAASPEPGDFLFTDFQIGLVGCDASNRYGGGDGCLVRVRLLEWGEDSGLGDRCVPSTEVVQDSVNARKLEKSKTFDVLIGSDILYDPSHVQPLAITIQQRMRMPDGEALLVGAVREPALLDSFLCYLKSQELEVQVTPVLDSEGRGCNMCEEEGWSCDDRRMGGWVDEQIGGWVDGWISR
ncbi:hypothetical protein CBR_g10813 [Chara braunii]|uniref:Uncharacterized protein n=1 Tax=Chara braunii TaxID=69332 RepID=A0A388KPB9_CHABU|nr:hypothetical protein CBR_g10813 [Chara braunii]|eukprot:GBG71877.1 hypothetical protein CBR_g10813 [Chara braunii]